MAEEEQAQEKTEEPSAKRLKESREKGQVARSKDFNATLILLFTAVGFLIFGKQLSNQLAQMMRQAFEFEANSFLTPELVLEQLVSLAKAGLWSLVPILVVIFLLSLGGPLLMGGWVFSSQTLQPKMSRLNILKGLQKMVSVKGLVEMGKSLLKFILVAAVTFIVLKVQIPALLALGNASLEFAVYTGGFIIIKSFLLIASSLILIALIDVPFQIYSHQQTLKMTKQELMDEHKETEGKPEVKNAIRRVQHAISKRRMMAEIPIADVVLMNPTHYAVAISYKKKGVKAPIVVAKGKDLMAFQISKIAKAHEVPIISVPPLARALYFSTKLNAEIPRGLYVAVAQVLAYIFQLRDKQYYEFRPEVLQNLPIPADLAREAEEKVE